MLKTREMAYPAPTKGRSKLSPNAAMLFAPFGCTHPPPPAPPFLLAQSLSLKDIAGCDIMKLKVSRCRYATLGLKGLRRIKTYLRTTMTQQRLNSLMVLHVHKEKTDALDLLQVGREFVTGREGRLRTFGDCK